MEIWEMKADRAYRYLGSVRKPSKFEQFIGPSVIFALALAAMHGDYLSGLPY